MFDISKCPKDKDGHLLAQTKLGDAVTLISINGREPQLLVGYIDNDIVTTTWEKNGRYFSSQESSFDLINIPEPKRSGEVWLLVYRGEKHRGALETTYAVPRGYYPEGEKIEDLIHKSGPYPWTEGDGLEGK